MHVYYVEAQSITAGNVTVLEGETAFLRCSVNINFTEHPDLAIYIAREANLTVSANNRYVTYIIYNTCWEESSFDNGRNLGREVQARSCHAGQSGSLARK